MLALLTSLVLIYLAAVWASTRLICRRPERRRIHRGAAGVSLGLAVVVGTVGVPLTRDSRGAPAFFAVLGLLVVAPPVAARLPPRGRWGALAGAALLLLLPIGRVEYLTLRHGEELQAAYDLPASDRSHDQLLFSVFDYSAERATVLRVEGVTTARGLRTAGYFVRFHRQRGVWKWSEPQAWLWSDAGNMRSRCPYPTSALLLLHGVGAADC